MRRQQQVGRLAATGGPVHAREAVVGLAVEAAGPGQEHLDPAHRDAAAIAIPVRGVLRMLWLSRRTRHRADAREARVVFAARGGSAIEPRRWPARETRPGPAQAP